MDARMMCTAGTSANRPSDVEDRMRECSPKFTNIARKRGVDEMEVANVLANSILYYEIITMIYYK